MSAQGRPLPPPPRFDTTDPACQNAQLVSTGGAFPKDPHTLAVRWTGFSNFELAYNGQIILLDAYFDRGSMFPPLGFKAADVRRADVILIGHGHFDHMSDAASVAKQTGAVVVGAPITVERLERESVNPTQVRTVNGRGGELLQFKGFTVEPILARHGEPPPDIMAAFGNALRSSVAAPTQEQTAERAMISARGSSDPKLATEGTLNYLITFDSGFRIMYRDSNGSDVTDFEKAAAVRVGPVDLAIVPTAGSYITSTIVERGLVYFSTYRPRTFMPAHHDAPYNNLWRPTEPLFQAIKDQDPTVVTVSRGYREPTCFRTK